MTNKISALDKKYETIKQKAVKNGVVLDDDYRDISEDAYSIMVIAPALVFGVATGIITGFVVPHQFSDSEVVALMMGGAAVGLGAGFLGTHLYENKTISNSIRIIKTKAYTSKMGGIENDRKKLQMALGLSNSNSQIMPEEVLE